MFLNLYNMLAFILFLLILFVVWPLLRFGWTIYRVRRQYNDTVNRARQAAREAEATRSSGGWASPRRKPSKKVRPDEGEYVEWEEITESTTTETTDHGEHRKTSSTSTYFTERISDAEWEDVKE